MQLYFVSRFGNDEDMEGADGRDTCFLVRAQDYNEAASLVDEYLETTDTQNDKCCHRIIEVATSPGSSRAVILWGPIISSEVLIDDDIGSDKKWARDCPEESWQSFRKIYE